MEHIPQHIINILHSTTFQNLTEQEQSDLNCWLEEDEENKRLWLRFSSKDIFKNDLNTFGKYDWESSFKTFEQNHLQVADEKIKKLFNPWYAAVSVMIIGLLIGISYYITVGQYEDLPSQAIVPAENHAEMLLPSGERITLNEGSDLMIIDSSFNINKKHSQAGSFVGIPSHFSVVTPKGKKYALQLPDGSKVWMSVDTRIAYDEFDSLRSLTLSGEAYFEVAKRTFKNENGTSGLKPFIVKTKGMHVEVLGTHFNVSAYPDAKIQRTTLMEGKVKVSNEKHVCVLLPGEEARLQDGKIVRKEIDTDQNVAWKDGYFIFNEDKLSDILVEVSKWYNVDIVYLDEEVKEEQYEGMLSRNSQLIDIISVLEGTNEVTFKFKKRTIYVSKK
ncbi:FecR family protein [Sphingobacterium sp. JUb56]|uniref:FecR family protein n=1 Tax=Sphingobacterium sp. JUb56 TaxID=2587145 RepID=UPI001614982C|nr:FecR family protein [Sphingobacterium sp. JUb56]MBB2949984.1 hypothetical protein [Sphingobacterium sp. JUb56]